jgi:hypothetical protein
MRLTVLGFVATTLLTGALPGAAQVPAATQSLPSAGTTRILPVQRISFERWCQEVQRYPIERCDARQPEDVRTFDAYRTIVERYETDFLKQRERERSVQESINRDPGATVRGLESAPAP